VLQDLQAKNLAWLQSEIIEKGEGSGLVPTDFDFGTEAGRNAFWADIEQLSDEKGDFCTTPQKGIVHIKTVKTHSVLA
ncbi:MAG: hypothetical protein AAGJ95_16570, partial [Cyanobacteria bacterium J06554_11]